MAINLLASSSAPWMNNVSQAELLITRACNPSMPEPNFALHLEVAEYINQKKANTPREAAIFIARLVNHRNPHIAMLALALLETLVQSCGYPFHLQISTKEFLNELVRRFPERPPAFPGPVMTRILELINRWKETICVESRFKDDFGNIRDMHRLLTFKGYRFREGMRTPTAAAPTANLKSAEELEEEDREAQSAKLQELIRRGTPRDLAAAQELMKTLAGANPEAKPDYRTQALNELNKLESKVILLNEILDNVDTTRGEKFATGDVYDQVASILRDARPKIQKWISNAETDDPESLDTFLQINDQINTVLNRYESYKKGDFVAAANPIPAELSNGAGPSASAQSVSLIDFDDDAPTSTAPSAGASGINDLAALFAAAPAASTPQPVAPSVGMGMFGGSAMAPAYTTPVPQGSNGFGSLSAAPPLNTGTRPGAVSPPGGMIRLGTPSLQQQAQIPQSPAPNFFGGSSGAGFQSSTPMQPQYQQQQQSQPHPPPAQTQGKDPFADLADLF